MTIDGYKHGRVPRAIREKQILDIAEKQFIELGYDEVSIESIRTAANVSRPMVYDYFGSKDQVYLACVKRARTEYENKLVEVFKSNLPLNDLILRVTTIYFEIVETNPKRWEALFAGSMIPAVGDLGKSLNDLRLGTIKHLINLITQHYPNIDYEKVDVFAHTIFAIGIQLGMWWISNPNVSKVKVISYNIAFVNGAIDQLAIK
ncbi:TetR/AcrR family transcriptional regulator [Acinetobacter sp. CE-15]|jgi:AcrR family transcriptional regulator|uniref:TetR/AcrR family transcriptional regulator n=1 Tax=Acinetobacter sp. CE-15 TaxID=3425693 RepID=UPI003DA23D97